MFASKKVSNCVNKSAQNKAVWSRVWVEEIRGGLHSKVSFNAKIAHKVKKWEKNGYQVVEVKAIGR